MPGRSPSLMLHRARPSSGSGDVRRTGSPPRPPTYDYFDSERPEPCPDASHEDDGVWLVLSRADGGAARLRAVCRTPARAHEIAEARNPGAADTDLWHVEPHPVDVPLVVR